jgi:plastocyanin
MRSCRPQSTAVAIAALCALVIATATPAAAAHFDVVTGSPPSFSPLTLTITAGDTVTFTNVAQGFHDVHADDNSFRCANGCDGQAGGDGSPSTAMWSFTLAFNTPGTVGYHCEIHGVPGGGMHGTITVNPAGGSPGNLAFSQGAYSVPENGGHATITVHRSGGTSGAVSVHYATSDGSGVAGTHYTSTSGTLGWGDGDGSDQSFDVPVLDDGVNDGSHTVNLALSSPTGGATLGTAGAVLTITNTDTSGQPPAAPTDLSATAVDATDVSLTWTLHSTTETAIRVQKKVLDGSPFADLLPLLPAGTHHLTVSGLAPGTGYGFRVRAENASGNSAYAAEADATTPPAAGPCVADANTLCLGSGGRFRVAVSWAAGDGTKGKGAAIPLAANPDSGLFYFFGPGNIEMLIKVLNACAPPFNAYWVFFAATTNVQFTVTVTDTVANKSKVYMNQLNHAADPVQDTSAFMTCP